MTKQNRDKLINDIIILLFHTLNPKENITYMTYSKIARILKKSHGYLRILKDFEGFLKILEDSFQLYLTS